MKDKYKELSLREKFVKFMEHTTSILEQMKFTFIGVNRRIADLEKKVKELKKTKSPSRQD